MHVHDALDVGPSLIQPSVNKHFLRRFQTIIPRNLLAVEIYSDDVARADKAQTAFLGAARFDEDPIFTRHSYTYVAARLFGQIELAKNPARFGNRFSQLRQIAHGFSSLQKLDSQLFRD